MTSANQPNVDELIARYLAAKGGGSGGNAQTITATVNGAGPMVTGLLTLALCVSTACCGYMAAATIGIREQLAQNQADLRGMQDYINVLYKRSADQKAKDDANHHP